MTSRISLVLALCAAAPALAQPAPRPPAPRSPAPRPAAAPAAVPDDLAAFDRDLDTLFAAGGLTADQVHPRAGAARFLDEEAVALTAPDVGRAWITHGRTCCQGRARILCLRGHERNSSLNAGLRACDRNVTAAGHVS